MLIVDNFYENPNKIIELVNGEYPLIGCGDGKRSLSLHAMNKELYEEFCNKIYSIHNLSSNGVWLTTYITEHTSNDLDVLNKRWVHIDGRNPDVCRANIETYNLILCGQIFLSEDPDPEAGVKICKLKKSINWTDQELIDNCVNDYLIPKDKYLSGLISLEDYTNLHTEYHNNFDISCDIKNEFNRMVSWKGGTLHGEPMTKKMRKRLTQYFFIQRV